MIVDSSTGIKMEEAVGKNEAGQVQVNPHLPPEPKTGKARGASLDILSNLNVINGVSILHQWSSVIINRHRSSSIIINHRRA